MSYKVDVNPEDINISFIDENGNSVFLCIQRNDITNIMSLIKAGLQTIKDTQNLCISRTLFLTSISFVRWYETSKGENILLKFTKVTQEDIIISFSDLQTKNEFEIKGNKEISDFVDILDNAKL